MEIIAYTNSFLLVLRLGRTVDCVPLTLSLRLLVALSPSLFLLRLRLLPAASIALL